MTETIDGEILKRGDNHWQYKGFNIFRSEYLNAKWWEIRGIHPISHYSKVKTKAEAIRRIDEMAADLLNTHTLSYGMWKPLT